MNQPRGKDPERFGSSLNQGSNINNESFCDRWAFHNRYNSYIALDEEEDVEMSGHVGRSFTSPNVLSSPRSRLGLSHRGTLSNSSDTSLMSGDTYTTTTTTSTSTTTAATRSDHGEFLAPKGKGPSKGAMTGSNTLSTTFSTPMRVCGARSGTNITGKGQGQDQGQDDDIAGAGACGAVACAPHQSHFCRIQEEDDHDAVPLRTSRSSTSRPIAIDIPKSTRFTTSSVGDHPPEPLSARGDLPGGYFPFHEDPRARVHRPHPFHHDVRHSTTTDTSSIATTTTTTESYRYQTVPFSTTTSVDPTMAPSDTPVASYIPSGYHHSPLPMGKYYPSNYEHRRNSQNSASGNGSGSGSSPKYSTGHHHTTSQRPSVSGPLPSSIKSDSRVPTLSTDSQSGPSPSTPDSEVRRRLRQYKRDMVAQAALAANELMGGAANLHAQQPRGGLSMEELQALDGRFTANLQRPISPRLLPLGSPGPVTPMELESGAGGSYLDQGRGDARRGRENLVPPGVGYTARTT